MQKQKKEEVESALDVLLIELNLVMGGELKRIRELKKQTRVEVNTEICNLILSQGKLFDQEDAVRAFYSFYRFYTEYEKPKSLSSEQRVIFDELVNYFVLQN